MKAIQFTTILFMIVLSAGDIQAQSWSTTGNTGTNATINYIGTNDAVNFKIRTNKNIRVNITSNGKVGIGNFSPVFKLDVKDGSINTDSMYRIKGEKALSRNLANRFQIGDSIAYVGIGTSMPSYTLHVEGNPASASSVVRVTSNHSSESDPIAVEAMSAANPGYGVGVYGHGGHYGLMGVSDGGNVSNWTTYGVYGSAQGFAGTHIGVYGEANGGTTNWAGFFYGNCFIDGNLGIGTANPQAKTHIKYNSTIPVPHLLLQEDDASDYARLSFQNSSAPSFWTVAAYNNATNASERMNFYNSTTGNIMSLTGDGKVGIGTINPSQKLTVFNGTSTGTYTTTGWMHASDARLKTNIKPLESSLDKILKLEGVSYNWKTNPADNNQIGFIAQEVEKVFPEVIVKDSEGNYSMAPQNLTAPIIEAIKEQQQQLEAKDAMIKELQSRLDNVESALSQCCMNYEQNAKVAFSTEGIAKLDQNIPNPFTANTVIKFFIPQNAGAGLIKIFSSDGSEIKSIPVSTKGSGQVEISGKTLQPGVYSYVLLLDGKFEVTRQMILTR